MIGNIDFQKHRGSSGGIINGILSNYKAHTKNVSADSFIEFVQNEINYNTELGTSVFTTTFLYFHIEALKLDDNRVLLIHPNSVNDYKLSVTVVSLYDIYYNVSNSVIIDSNDMSAETHKAIVIDHPSENVFKIFVAHCIGDGATYLQGRIVRITQDSNTNQISTYNYYSNQLSNNRGSSGWINLFNFNSYALIVHTGDNGVAIGAPAVMKVEFSSNKESFTKTTDTYLTENEMSYDYTYACLVGDDRVLVVHSSDSSNKYLDAIVFRYKTAQDTYGITLGSNTRIETTQYAAQGCRCVYFKDGYALITYDDSDALSGKLIKIDGLNITILKKVYISAATGAYEHEILPLSDTSLFITYCADALQQLWNYNVLYLVGDDIVADTAGTFTPGTSADIPWPASGASALALAKIVNEFITIFYADTDNKTKMKLMSINNEDIVPMTPYVDQNLKNLSGIIKIADDKLFFTYAYTDGTVTGRLCGGVLSTADDNIQVLSTSRLIDEDNSAFIESANHRMVLNQIVDNKAEIIILHNKYISQNNFDLYYGIAYVDLTTNDITFTNKTKLNSVNQGLASHSIIKIDNNCCLVTMTSDATNGYLFGQLYSMQYGSNNKLTEIVANTTVTGSTIISSCRDSAWMYNYVQVDDNNFIFFFRDYNNSMYIYSSIVNVVSSGSTYSIDVASSSLLINKSEAAMLIQPAKVSDGKILLFCCDYDPNQGAWGAWYTGAAVILYDIAKNYVSWPTNQLTRVSTYSSADAVALNLDREDVVCIYEDYDSSQNAFLAARKFQSIFTEPKPVSDVITVDNTNTYSDNMFAVELEEGRHLLVHPDSYSNWNITAQIIYTPNFIGPSIIEANQEIHGLSKTDISINQEGEVYTKA